MVSDTFIEQIIKQKPSAMDILKRFLVGMVGATLAIVATFIFLNSPTLGPIALLVAVGAVYFSVRIITAFSFEYEYIYTNGEIDVDRIAGKRKRKRITTVKITAFDVFEKYDFQKHSKEKFDVKINASISPLDEGTYCAIYTGKEGKRCILLFSPNERLLEAIGSIAKRRRV